MIIAIVALSLGVGGFVLGDPDLPGGLGGSGSLGDLDRLARLGEVSAGDPISPTTPSTSVPDESGPVDRPGATTAETPGRHGAAPVADPAMAPNAAPVHEVLVGSGEPPSAEGPSEPIGSIDPSGLVPEGLDLTAFPGVAEGHVPSPTPSVGGPDSLSPGAGCAYQCISSGVAYPRGFGAELVVETRVPADLWMSVIADTNGDGDFDVSEYHTSPGKVTKHSWALDHLEPGQTYHAMVVATDEHHDASHGFGEFTTLSTRSVEVAINEVEITGGPTNVSQTHHLLRVEGGDLESYDLGAQRRFDDVDRRVDVELVVAREWPGQLCEGLWLELFDAVFGDSDDSCVSWNTARVFSVDLDQVPARNRWTSVSFTAVARSPEGVGESAPRWFDLAAYVPLNVIYS